MSAFREFAAVTAIALRGMPQRWGTSAIIVVGVAAVVAVLVSVLAMAAGLRGAATSTARQDRAIVLRGGSTAELNSVLLRNQALTIMDAPGVALNSNAEPIASAEVVLTVILPLRSGGDANFALRGVGSRLLALRPETRIVAGRMFNPQLKELIVGRAAQLQSHGLDVGARINLHGDEWTITGVFASGGDWHESELMAANVMLLSEYQRVGFQSVTVRLTSPAAFAAFKDALTQNPALSVSVQREVDYYASVAGQLTSTLFMVAYVIGAIMAAGALFGAVNCLYSAVATRTAEIATLRAIGFGGEAVVASVFVEALVLALLGAALGCVIAWIIFDGASANALGSLSSFSQVIFRLAVQPSMMTLGVVWACAVGLTGAVFPAFAAARVPVAVALRRT